MNQPPKLSRLERAFRWFLGSDLLNVGWGVPALIVRFFSPCSPIALITTG